jgi:hypothetical protein
MVEAKPGPRKPPARWSGGARRGSPADRRTLLALIALKRRVQARQHACLLEVFYGLLVITGYPSLCERAGYPGPLCDLGVFSRLVAAFDEHAGTRTLYPFLKLMRQGGVDPAIAEPEDAVRVMTIHQARDSSSRWSSSDRWGRVLN